MSDRPSPRHRKCEHERVQPRIVESFADVLACRQQDALLIRRDGFQLVGESLALLLPHSAPKNEQMANASRKVTREAIEVVVALGQNEGRPSVANCFDNVVADAPITRLVVDQFAVQALELHSLIRVGAGSLEAVGRTRTVCSKGRAAACIFALTR
ncbi:MAG TPA: hypothetical protein VGQ36_23915 [Thermoanaerobaculia bacterium]|nr:hypothetical protein [Thermoanaerobaculia bacterium]